MAAPLRLGLIGDAIAASSAPRLHALAGAQSGRVVTYDLLVPRELGRTYAEVFAACAAGGYRGLNITYPYKERVTDLVRIEDPLVRAMGAVNTVLFEPGGPRGFNTDHTGFIAAYRAFRGGLPPGRVAVIGTGGVGRAIAFGLVALGAEAIGLVDADPARAKAVAADLDRGPRAPGAGGTVIVADRVEALPWRAEGLVNATPLGMAASPGSPVHPRVFAGAGWAFDAVYTPVDTTFLRDAAAAGLAILSGWELFFEQGVDAWTLFSGAPPDREALRRALNPPG